MKHIIKITLSLLILFTFNGCHKNDMDSLFPNQGEVQEYNLNLSVGEMVAGTNEQLPSTRAISDEISSDIKNLWVIQVSNKDNKIVSTPTYISNYINGVNVKLVPCYDDDSYKIIYIANTFKNNLEIYKGDNLDDIADLVKPIVSEKDCYTTALQLFLKI